MYDDDEYLISANKSHGESAKGMLRKVVAEIRAGQIKGHLKKVIRSTDGWDIYVVRMDPATAVGLIKLYDMLIIEPNLPVIP